MTNAENMLIKEIVRIAKKDGTSKETAMGACILAIRVGAVDDIMKYIKSNSDISTDDIFREVTSFCENNSEIYDFAFLDDEE